MSNDCWESSWRTVCESVLLIPPTTPNLISWNIYFSEDFLNQMFSSVPWMRIKCECVLYSKLCITWTYGEQKKCSKYKEFRVRRCFWMGKRRKSLGELYVLRDSSSYAEFSVIQIFLLEFCFQYFLLLTVIWLIISSVVLWFAWISLTVIGIVCI